MKELGTEYEDSQTSFSNLKYGEHLQEKDSFVDMVLIIQTPTSWVTHFVLKITISQQMKEVNIAGYLVEVYEGQSFPS